MKGAGAGRLPARVTWRILLLFAVLSAASLGAYLVASGLTYRMGFPLDDAWIHQVYARNLALRGEWSFVPGEPSAGSTAPLWSALLAIGHILGLPPILWAVFLGWLGLTALAVMGYQFLNRCTDLPHQTNLWIAGLLLLEWHLVWAAGSGMETLVMALVPLVVVFWLAGEGPPWFWIGALVGLSAWIRPDGLTLLGPVALLAFLKAPDWMSRLRLWALTARGWLSAFGPYLVFNRLLAGAWWPNTFYAKQAEYLTLRDLPLLLRYWGELQLPLIGVGALLFPGFLYAVYRAWRSRRWALLAAAIWWFGYLGVYAWGLPVTYQHGRYLIPAMPVYFLLGAVGLFEWALAAGLSRPAWILSRAWLVSAFLVLLAFWGFGARAYARDVAFIESEMVAVARWIGAQTPPEAVIAAHDIGAIGFFAERRLIDLAGLVSPDVIPFIRDEERLAEYLDRAEADYLVTFPSWYPVLVAGSTPVYQTSARYAPDLGGENMAVYRWRR